MEELQTLLLNPPKEVAWKNIVDFDKFDDRMYAVEAIIPNIIGVCQGYVEFCPDSTPPKEAEILNWIWAIRPDLSHHLKKLQLSTDLKFLIECYETDDLEEFWHAI